MSQTSKNPMYARTAKPKRLRMRDLVTRHRSSTVGGEGYKVGYKKPPLHTRFRKGQSGNPSGKRKRDAGIDVRRQIQDLLLDDVVVRSEGKKAERLPFIIALIKRLLSQATKDEKAFREVMRLSDKFGVFNYVRKPRTDFSWMTPEQREAADQAFLLLRKAGLTRET